MKRLLILLCFPASLAAQTIGAGVTVGAGVSIGAPNISTAPSGLVFSPPAQHFSGTESVSVSYTPASGNSIFYTSDATPVSPASTLYSGPVSLSSTGTINALAYSVGTVRQNVSSAVTGWKTDVDTSNPTPFTITGNCPRMATGGGVAGVITDCEFDATALSNTALHLSFTSATTGTSQRQVLWTMGGGSCDDCTEWTQSFDIQPAENETNVWAYENDSQLWDGTRRLELTTGLQCYAGDWNVSGQSGWTKSGVSANCPPPAGQWTHVETHGHRVIGLLACTYAGAPIECIYYDWISVNGVKTVLNKTFPAHPLPTGWAGGCYSQSQLDTRFAGTVGVYLRNKNMTCGYGTQATGTSTYTKP